MKLEFNPQAPVTVSTETILKINIPIEIKHNDNMFDLEIDVFYKESAEGYKTFQYIKVEDIEISDFETFNEPLLHQVFTPHYSDDDKEFNYKLEEMANTIFEKVNSVLDEYDIYF
jgi:hypothetical protein